MAGAALSLGAIGSYVPNIINGRGFIVIAIVILGRWSVLGAAAGSLLIAALNAIELALAQELKYAGSTPRSASVGRGSSHANN